MASEMWELYERRNRCPGCAPGYGSGSTCRHHYQAAKNSRVVLNEKVRTLRTLMVRYRYAYFGVKNHG